MPRAPKTEDFTDAELYMAGRGLSRLLAGHKQDVLTTLASMPRLDEALSARLQAVDARYVRQLETLDRTFGAACAVFSEQLSHRAVRSFLRAWERHAVGRHRALLAARKRHPEVAATKGRPARGQREGLVRGMALYSRRPYDRWWFVSRIRKRWVGPVGLAEAIDQDAKAAGYALTPKRREWLRKRFHEWDIEFGDIVDRD